MTHPDWQSIVQWTGAPFLSEDGLVLGAGGLSFGPFQVSNYRSLLVAARPGSVFLQVAVQHSAGGAPAGIETISFFDFRPGVSNAFVLPLYGDVIDFVAVTPSVAGFAHDVLIAPTNQEGPVGIGLARLVLQAAYGTGIGAASVSSFTSARQHMGRARFRYLIHDAAGAPMPIDFVTVDHAGYNGAGLGYSYIAAQTASGDSEIVMPASPWTITFDNSGGAAGGTFYFALHAVGR